MERRVALGIPNDMAMIRASSFSMGCSWLESGKKSFELNVGPELPNLSKQQLYRFHTVTVESRDVRMSLTMKVVLSEKECVSV